MCRKKNTVNQRKGPKTLQGITTLYSLRQNSECGVANDRTMADCNQLFRFCAWPERKINFRYAVVVPPVVVLKVSINTVQRDLITVNTRQLIKNSDFLPLEHALFCRAHLVLRKVLWTSYQTAWKRRIGRYRLIPFHLFLLFFFFAELILWIFICEMPFVVRRLPHYETENVKQLQWILRENLGLSCIRTHGLAIAQFHITQLSSHLGTC